MRTETRQGLLRNPVKLPRQGLHRRIPGPGFQAHRTGSLNQLDSSSISPFGGTLLACRGALAPVDARSVRATFSPACPSA